MPRVWIICQANSWYFTDFFFCKKIDSFAVLAPLSEDDKNPNYKIKKIDKKNINNLNPFKVESVDGFAMLINKSKFKVSYEDTEDESKAGEKAEIDGT